MITIPLSGAVTRTGGYDGVVRNETAPDPIRFDSDLVISDVVERDEACPESGGIVITVDGCPNCGGSGYP